MHGGTAIGASPIQFTDVTAQTGIAFRHTDGHSGRYYIVESVSAGLALFDYDSDGDIDIYFLNGAPLDGADTAQVFQNQLYRNDGQWRFTNVTKQAEVGDPGFGMGVAIGDYDNDGHADIYVNNFGRNVLYRNQGDGTFQDVTDQAGVANGDRVGAGACFLDIDGDGDLDLYVASYVQFTYATHVKRTMRGYPVYAGPRDFQPEADTLYINQGDGTFRDGSEESGIAAVRGPGMGMVCADYDNDGDTDIFVGNDAWPNFLFRNDGTGKFEEIGLRMGFAYDGLGAVRGTMGVEAGDVDNDGWIDLHVTAYQDELATLYRNLNGSFLDDVTLRTGAGAGTQADVSWGNCIADFDNDGHRDLFIAFGHLHDQIDKIDNRHTYQTRNRLIRNLGNGKFLDATDEAGDGLNLQLSSRGAAVDDLDNDGDLDIVVLNSRREPTLLRNESTQPHHWLGVQLRGTKTNRDGVGARVEVVAGNQRWVDEVHSGRGYQSHYGSRLHFGLGKNRTLQEVRVRWIGGETQTIRNVAVDQVITVVEQPKP
jgi:hypothetical protein